MKYRDENGIFQDLYLPPTGDTLPIGSITEFGGQNIPYGWLVCDGSAVSRTTYVDLFKAIGTAYGEGNGSTTFNLPDFRDRVPVGLDEEDEDFNELGKTGGSKYLQGHKHSVAWSVTETGSKGSSYDGIAFVRAGGITADSQLMWSGYVSSGDNKGIKDLNGNSIETGNSGNLPPYVTVNYIIKAKQTVGAVGTMATEYTESSNAYYNAPYINDNFQTKGFILYDNASGNTGDISLSDDVSNYDYLEVFGFESINQSQLYAKYDVSLNKNFTISSIIGQQNGDFMRIDAKTYVISGSSMTVNNSSHVNVFTQVINEQRSTTSISITKVIGYKTNLFN